LQIVAQQILAIQLDQRVEVETRLDPRRAHHDQRQVVAPSLPVRHTPRQGRQCPKKELEVRSRNADPQPRRSLRKQPRVTDVAVERGLEKIDQHEADLVDATPEIGTRQTVSTLVCRYEQKADRQNQPERREMVQAGKVLNDWIPTRYRRAGCEENDSG